MFDEARLDRLIAAYFDQQLTPEEKRELEAMLLASSRARQVFLDQSGWHGLTREWALQSHALQLMGDPEPEETSPPVSAGKALPFRRKAALAAGLAACLALGWWLVPSPRDTETPGASTAQSGAVSPDDVALLSQAVDVEWDEGGISHSVGAALPKGLLKIRKGTLRLDFYSGARVFLEGPATLDLLSPDLARLDYGKLTASVPPPAQGFTILSSDLRVVDRGTEFGMSVNGPDDCEVHVFDGEVELQGEVPATGERTLFEGDAASIRQGKWLAFAANRGSFTDPAAILLAAARQTEARWESWRTSSESLRRSPDLLVHFDFEDMAHGDIILRNGAHGADVDSHGTVIGCDLLPGRWPGKSALGFASTSDRVRFRMDGTAESLTMMAWVRVDSLPQDHNALLSVSPDLVGEIHWKLNKSGQILIGIRAESEFTFEAWERLESPPIVTNQDFGRWIHLATVIDGENGVLRHYVNGREVASGPLQRRPLLPLGMANLGNFDAAASQQPRLGVTHGFNGRIDEFALLKRALTADEIAALK